MKTQIQSAQMLANAITFGSRADVVTLIDNGARVDLPEVSPFGDVMYPVCLAVGKPEILQFLLEKGASPNVRVHGQGSPLEIAVATFESELDAELLLKHGAHVDGRDTDGYTALMVSCGNIAVASLLISNGADVNAETNKGWTALMAASVQADPPFVELLLKSGARINHKDKNGISAIKHAYLNRRAENVRYLALRGAITD